MAGRAGSVSRRRTFVSPARTCVVLSWSGGKDSMLALDALLRQKRFEVKALLTTVSRAHGRISMHGVRETLLDRQAGALGIALDKIYLSETPSNEEYQQQMRRRLEKYRDAGIRDIGFGDIFLKDIRAYRETQLDALGLRGVFPIWRQPTGELAERFIGRGFRATLACVDTEALSVEFAGREYDRELLNDLPPGCDPCGENGEFHTFVYDGPLFTQAIPIATGEKVLRDERFCFCDLLLAPETIR